MSKADECVKVVVRVRPISGDEERNGNVVAVEAFPDTGLLTVKNPKANESEPPKSFTFDAVFGPVVEQKHIYNVCAANVVESVLSGYNGTIFAYGQTGSGKTHTMEGRPDPPNLRGIIPNSFQHIFDHISSAGDEKQFLVRASYLEIYNEDIRDLLSKDPKFKLELKENIDSGVYVKDLTSYVVKNVTEIDHVVQAGKKNRSVGATLMNATSSRSHSIFTVVVECAEGGKIRVGKLNLVDLAGSERQSKTGATGDRFKEATNINLSLTALGNVISALVDSKVSYIPYRDSKLTRLLQNSLGGNAKTVMCANCGPADYNYDETLSTLRYANRAKNIKNKPKINEDPKDAMLREYQEEIQRLKEQLEATQRGVMIDENGKEMYIHNAKQEIVEKIVEREKIVEVRVDMTAEQLAAVHKKAAEEKQVLMRQAQEDMKQLIDQQSRTVAERSELQAALQREADDRKKIEDQKQKLLNKLKNMEEKLIQGGEAMTKVSQQESQLRKANKEVLERQQEQLRLHRELAEKEEANLVLEEHFSSLQEEVEVKSKKLKKLLAKYQGAVQEAKDLQQEFQTERSDMLENMRQLTRDMKLKDLIIAHFIPEEYTKSIERRAYWNSEDECWTIQKIELSGNGGGNTTSSSSNGSNNNSNGNNFKAVNRPISNSKLKRPETEYTRNRRQVDTSPRYRYENIISLDLDLPEKTTQDFEGPNMVSRVDDILRMDLNDDDNDIVEMNEYLLKTTASGSNGNNNHNNPNIYQQYPGSNNTTTSTITPTRGGSSGSSSGNNESSSNNDDRGDRDQQQRDKERRKARSALKSSADNNNSSSSQSSDMDTSDRRSTSRATKKSSSSSSSSTGAAAAGGGYSDSGFNNTSNDRNNRQSSGSSNNNNAYGNFNDTNNSFNDSGTLSSVAYSSTTNSNRPKSATRRRTGGDRNDRESSGGNFNNTNGSVDRDEIDDYLSSNMNKMNVYDNSSSSSGNRGVRK